MRTGTRRALAVLVVGLISASPLAACRSSGPGPTRTTGSSPADTTLPRGPGVTPPPVGGRFDYQIGGAYPPVAEVTIVGRDRSRPVVRGRYNICYVNALQTQPDEPGQSRTDPPLGTVAWWLARHPDLIVQRGGRPVIDEDWDEAILDVSTPQRRTAIMAIERPWIEACHRGGSAAVEPDNLDSYQRSAGAFDFTVARQFMVLFSAEAHRLGLAVAQKNAGEECDTRCAQAGLFDFAVAEECEVYRECAVYARAYGRRVIEIEYTDQPAAAFARACAERGATWSIIRRDRDVVPRADPGYRYETCPAGTAQIRSMTSAIEGRIRLGR